MADYTDAQLSAPMPEVGGRNFTDAEVSRPPPQTQGGEFDPLHTVGPILNNAGDVAAAGVQKLDQDTRGLRQDAATYAGNKYNQYTGRSDDIDYRSGASPFWLRELMSRSANPEEGKLVLDKFYGPGNYGQDEGGRWWVNQDGKKVAVFPSGFTEGLENVGAGLAATSTPMAGSVLGAAIGTPAGPFGMALGAGLGYAGGYGVDQLIKYYQGLYKQTPSELVKGLGNEAALNMALAGTPAVARTISRPIGNWLRDFLGTTPTTRKMTERLVNENVRPPIQSVAPDFRSWGDKQVLRNAVAGDPWEETNAAYIRSRFTDSLKSSGVSDAEIATFLEESANPVTAYSHRPAGELLSRGVQERLGAYRAEATAARASAEQQLRSMEQSLRDYANAPVGRLGEDVANAIIGERKAFGNAATRVYTAIDQMTGEAQIFPTAPTINAAKQWINLAEPGLVPPYIQQLAAREDKAITFADAHEIRNNLRELIGGIDLTRTPYMHKLADVQDALNDTFRWMEGFVGMPRQAAVELRAADKMYGEGIAKFHNTQIKKLVADVRDGIYPDPEVVAATIIRPGQTETANQIMKLLPEEVRQNVLRADMRNIMLDSSRRGPDGINYLDGMAFLNQIEARESIYRNHYSARAINELKDLGRTFAAMDGKLDVTKLPPGGTAIQAIRDYVTRTNQIDAFVQRNPLAQLASGNPEAIDRAAHFLGAPGHEATTEAAYRAFGPTSQEFKAIQRSAQASLVRAAIVETPSRTMTISGPSIERELRKYTAKQQEMLFPEGMADDLKEIAKEARFLFPPRFGASNPGQATSLAAKNITLNTGIGIWKPRTFNADAKWVGSSVMGWITDRPAVLRFLADTSRRDPTTARMLFGSLSRWIINGQESGSGTAKPQTLQ